MKSERPYIYCPGGNCPLKDQCKRFRPDIDKKKNVHWAYPPPKLKKDGSCQYFDKEDDNGTKA